MNRTTNIAATIFIILLLSGAYFLMMSDFKTTLNRHVRKVEASEGTIEHLEANLDALATNKLIPSTPQIDNSNEIRRETQAAQIQMETEISYLKTRLTDSEQSRDKITKTLEDRIKDLTGAQDALHEEIENSKKREIQLETQKASLEGQVHKLNGQLSETQEQFSALRENAAENAPREIKRLKDELIEQETKLEKITGLYDRLKGELKTFAETINSKDDTIAAKDKEIESLKTQLNYIALKFSDLDKSMNKSEKNQTMLTDKLNQMKDLNSTLQKYIAQVDGYINEQKLDKQISQISEITGEAIQTAKTNAEENDPQRERANELKKQVEVILQPQK